MKDSKPIRHNIQLVSYCPICGRELMWAPIEPINPEVDYVAFCMWCKREFGVAVNK